MEAIPGWLFFTNILRAIWASLTFDAATFDLVLQNPQSINVSIAVVLLAGLSHLIGQYIVLIINQAPLAARVRAIALGLVMVVAEFLLWMLAIWLIAGVVFRVWDPPIETFRVLGIAYAPMILGVVVLIPYAGPALFQALRMWTVLAVIVATSVAFELDPRAAAVCAVAGWLGHYPVVRLLGRFTGTDDSNATLRTDEKVRRRAAQEAQRRGAA
ncbi:MAG: hypothetical protein U0556_18480 [Dehalococcoidia bacterium]